MAPSPTQLNLLHVYQHNFKFIVQCLHVLFILVSILPNATSTKKYL